ncbi:SDR family oxidoreductase [Gulosibacter molinativorax]|uniref:SDR family oxidoreductase n=1 Tax=Gulosibacter molinativorax TaxID=256821 RepID=A0ABT7C9L3_9MICO|nr:SDR family NAD(P)-dependent oxidoreductase [Gulosibacter molinativorax]MDJ1371904.1 SDR family oxidoreductase [Gulosibacter molinativorax]QUY62553.1 Short-chain dehydrogenase [Gulosibacter molinativorax]
MSSIDTFEGRVAVVTGGASGIGRGIAEALIDTGATVVIADVNEDGAKATATEIGAIARSVDVTNIESVEALAQSVLDELGRVDIVVNNAGVGPLIEFEEVTLKDFRWVMDINFWGVVNGMKTFLPTLKANDNGGYIVNTASLAAVVPGPGTAAYGASKAAILSVSDTVAIELEADGTDNIGISVLMPAMVKSNITENARKRPGFDAKTDDTESFQVESRVLEAREVGDMVVDAIRSGNRYIFTHPETREAVAAHQADILAGFDQQ